MSDQQQQQQPSGKIRLCGLWKNQSANGTVYLNGNLSGTSNLVIFPNGFKQKENDPDYIVYVQPRIKKDQQDGMQQAQPAQVNSFPPAQQQMQQPPMQQNQHDDIPF